MAGPHVSRTGFDTHTNGRVDPTPVSHAQPLPVSGGIENEATALLLANIYELGEKILAQLELITGQEV